MALSCVFSPVDKNNKPYKALPEYKKAFGRQTGKRAFLKALSPSFQKRNEKVLTIDSQGVATIDSAMRTSDMRNFVGFEKTKEVLEKQHNFNKVANTADNFRRLLNEAKNFNDNNSDYIAYPEVFDTEIKNVIHKKNQNSVEAFNNRYGSMVLNDRLLQIFEPLGLKIGDLLASESSYSGVTDFSNAKNIAGEFIDLIRVANNMSGQLALSEEFSHLIVRMLRDKPSMQRLINAFAATPEALKTILGEDYQLYVEHASDEEGSTNYAAVAEEAVGRLLQGKLQEEVAKEFNTSYIGKLWKRLIDYIKKAFKYYKISDVEQAVIEADQTIGNLAKNLLNGSISFTRKDIEKVLPNNVEQEMQDIKAKAQANGTFMKAPNGKPTNLTERQWLQVRTKNFINWFGDWTKAHYGDVSVDIAAPRDADGIPTEQRIYLNGKVVGFLPHYKGKIVTPSDVTVILKPEYRNKGIAKKAYIAIASYYKSQGITFKSDDYLSKDAIRLWDSLVRDGYARKTFENLEDNDEFQSANESHYRVSYEFINDNIPNSLDSSVSKVVDENGEPLVVWHGGSSVNIFDTSGKRSGGAGIKKGIKGSYFTTSKNDAKRYEEIYAFKTGEQWIAYADQLREEDATEEEIAEIDRLWETQKPATRAFFLNIKTPIETIYTGNDKDGYTENTITPENYDGQHITIEGKPYEEYVATNPNQIKSATDNNGMFSTENDDIMYHLEEAQNNTSQVKKELDDINKIIEDAIATETKKTIIIKNDKAVERAEKKADNLNAVLKGTPEGKIKGLINYALAAVTDLSIARDAILKSAPGERNFTMLRGVWSTILSYSDFIDQLGALINSEDDELKKLLLETAVKGKDEVLYNIGTAYRELSALRDLVKNRYKQIAFDSIEEFFKPFFGVKDTFIDSSGRERTLRQLIEEANGDIGFIDTYFMTMSSSGDLLLQLFNEVIRQAKADARFDTIDDIHDIIKLMLEAQDKGITSFEWIFEHDRDGRKTGNYISAVNTGQFEKEKREFFKALDEEYGKNPRGEKAKEKIAKRKAWLKEHSVFFGSKPNAVFYHNTEFDKLSSNQKDILTKFMQIKQKFDKRIPPSKTSASRAIQMRRTSQQRLLDSMSNPKQAFQNIQEAIAKELTKTSDDDALYGERTGLRSFDGSEFKVLPVLYTARLSNPDELSTDIFSALAAYSYATNTYKQMDKVVDPLEVARTWISDKSNRSINQMSNKKQLVEKVGGVARKITKNNNSNIIEKLDNCMDSQVYQRYYKDSDKTINMMGRELKAGKIVNWWLSLSSTVQLGFNALAHLANAATGIGMQNIEAFSGQYFNAKELGMADAAYIKALMDFIPDIESKNPKSKLALFDQLFDIKQEFAGNIKNQMNKTFEKLFGKSLAFLGQTCGDHWLYNRTAIAMCLRKKVRLQDGTITSLWEALQVENVFKGDGRIKHLTINAVDAETGEVIDRNYIRKYSDKINEINKRLFGVYNSDDMVAAQRVALGRAVLQYRQWIVPLFARRFQDRKYIAALDEYEEGYYRTVLSLMAGLKNGMEGLKETWDEFDEGQKRNIYRAITEVSQFLLIWAIANFVDFGKGDPDRSWALKMAEYMAQRELHELGNLTPSFTMGQEMLKTIKSPASILNTTQAALNLTASILDPRDWFDEIESGKYEGMSTLHKNFLKAPFPILAPFNQLDRVIDNIDETTRYYARSY